MANFWDTHDSTELEEGEIEAIEYKPKRLVLTVRVRRRRHVGHHPGGSPPG